MSHQIVQPAFMTVRQWADAIIPDIEYHGNIGRLERDEDWREWGAQLLNLPALGGSIVPDPYQFDDWREWAQRLVENLSVM